MTDSPQEGQTPQPDLADPKDRLILLVDDDEGSLDLLKHVVEKEGFRTERSANGSDAIRKVGALQPALVILDFMLPGIGGFEVLKELQMGESRAIPVVVLTGRRIDRQTVEMIRQEPNVKEFLEKPVKPVILSSMLHRILGTRPPEVRRGADQGRW